MNPTPPQAPTDCVNEIVVNPVTYSVRWRGRRCHLGNSAEFRCLRALCACPNDPVENDEMIKQIDTGYVDHPNHVRITVFRLRKKLQGCGLDDLAARIKNVRGAYVLHSSGM